MTDNIELKINGTSFIPRLEDPLFQPSDELYESVSHWRGKVLVLEGLVGVGKSTLGRSLTQFLNQIGLPTRFFPEFVNEPLLKLYFSDMPKYAFPFQSVMIRERIMIYQRARELADQGMFCIIDRSIYGDMAFANMQLDNGYFNQEEWETYLSLIRSERLPAPSATVFLNCSPELAFERMKTRSIQAEVDGYSVEYFQALLRSYQKVMSCYQCQYHSLDWTSSLSTTERMLDKEELVHHKRRTQPHDSQILNEKDSRRICLLLSSKF